MSSAPATTCPNCGKVVDPLRARSVGVRDGKVVAYCSVACATAADEASARHGAGVSVKVRTPAAGVAVTIPTSPDSGPVIEIIREGSVPVGKAKKDRTAPVAKVDAERRDHTPTPVELARRRAELAAAEEADDDAEINGEDAPPARKLPVGLIAVVVVVLAGAAAAGLHFMH